jgi:hypothetical protein
LIGETSTNVTGGRCARTISVMEAAAVTYM